MEECHDWCKGAGWVWVAVGAKGWVLACGACRQPHFGRGNDSHCERRQCLVPGDPYGQAKAIFAIVGSALEAVGASFGDVVRTRIFLKDIAHWQEVGRAHGEIFSEIRPASTMVEVSRLIDPAHLVEIEVDAIIANAKSST